MEEFRRARLHAQYDFLARMRPKEVIGQIQEKGVKWRVLRMEMKVRPYESWLVFSVPIALRYNSVSFDSAI